MLVRGLDSRAKEQCFAEIGLTGGTRDLDHVVCRNTIIGFQFIARRSGFREARVGVATPNEFKCPPLDLQLQSGARGCTIGSFAIEFNRKYGEPKLIRDA